MKNKNSQHIWIIKAGGELLAKTAFRENIFRDLGKLSTKESVALVHGGGPQIEKNLKKNRIPIKFVGGRRFTSTQAMDIVEKTLSGTINKSLVADLVSMGLPATGLSGRDGNMLIGKPLPHLGRAAKPCKVNAAFLRQFLLQGLLPVISSVANDKKGQTVNINADDAASALAIALKAQKLVFLTDISGVRNQQQKRIPILKTKQIDSLIRKKVITRGMIPKVQSAKNAIKKGVGEVVIANGKKGINFNFATRIKH